MIGERWKVTDDRCQVTCDMWFVTSDTWNLTHDIWNTTNDTWHNICLYISSSYYAHMTHESWHYKNMHFFPCSCYPRLPCLVKLVPQTPLPGWDPCKLMRIQIFLQTHPIIPPSWIQTVGLYHPYYRCNTHIKFLTPRCALPNTVVCWDCFPPWPGPALQAS